MATYSHSRLGCFQQCKQKFKFQYIDKIKVAVPDTIETFTGRMVHQTLEKLYKDLQFQKMNTLLELLAFFEAQWAKEWSDQILIAGEYGKENHFAMGRKFISDYYEHYTPFNQLTTLGLETEDKLVLSDGSAYHIRIDRLACDKAGNYSVCDYKTNNRLKAQGELDEDRQLAMYSIWVHKNFKDCKSVKLVWYFLAFDKELVSERSSEQLTRLQAETVALIQEIESCKEFPTSVSNLCDWCVYKNICPAWKHEIALEKKTEQEFKADDGVQLVDAYASLSEQKRALESELDTLKERLIAFSKQKDVSVVFGSEKKASVKAFETVSFPPKAEREALNAILKKNDLWEAFSDLDTHKLMKAVKESTLPEQLEKEIEAFITKAESYRISLAKRKGMEEE